MVIIQHPSQKVNIKGAKRLLKISGIGGDEPLISIEHIAL